MMGLEMQRRQAFSCAFSQGLALSHSTCPAAWAAGISVFWTVVADRGPWFVTAAYSRKPSLTKKIDFINIRAIFQCEARDSVTLMPV